MRAITMLPRKRIAFDTIRTGGSNVFSLEEFKALVKYERSRSDRNGSVFSVAVFKASSDLLGGQKRAILCISKFSRSIDCVGLGEAGQIAVLLPDTVAQGAGIFARKVLDELEKIGERDMGYSVYTYPEHWLRTDDEPGSSQDGEGKGYESIKDSIEFLFVQKIPLWKRALDIAGASLMLVLASPVLLFLGLYIKAVSPGPVFYKQTRIGYKGTPFTFWKFRTMKMDNNEGFHGAHAQSFISSGDVPMEKLDAKDPRIILGGKVIRKSCLDELPQIWNIIRGDMSLVGPRPCIPYEAKEYLRWHTHRFDVLPGLSGLWQISGKNKLTFKQMVRLDIAYCRNMSLLGDLSIIVRTPIAILKMMFEATLNKYTGSSSGPLAMHASHLPNKAV